MPGHYLSDRPIAHQATIRSLHNGTRQYRRRHQLAPAPRLKPTWIMACPALGRQIAAAYEAAPIYQSAAQLAYRAFRDETWRQLDFLTLPRHKRGLGISVVITPVDPYRTVDELLADLAEQRLRIWATAAGSNPHPLLSEHDNDAFRAVHAAFGHGSTGRGLDADGEEAAWWKQQSMYTPLAGRALLTETRGQASALLYGTTSGSAAQKATLLDERFGDIGTRHYAVCDGRCLP